MLATYLMYYKRNLSGQHLSNIYIMHSVLIMHPIYNCELFLHYKPNMKFKYKTHKRMLSAEFVMGTELDCTDFLD